MPCFFQASRCDASDELAISTAKTLLAYSWPIRWNTRSAPVRSTRTSTPYLALKAPAIFSDTDRSIEVYQTTLPSFFAASISCGVIASAGGASARAAVANTVPSASAVVPLRISRREGIVLFIASSVSFSCLSAQRAAAVGRHRQPDLAAFADIGFGRRGDTQRRAVSDFDHVVARCAKIDLTGPHGLDRVFRRSRRLRRKPDVVLADCHRRTLARRQRRTD